MEENKDEDKIKEELLKRWSPILDNMKLPDNQKNWMSEHLANQYTDQHKELLNNTPVSSLSGDTSGSTTNFNGIVFPMVRRVFSQLIGESFDEEGYTNEKRKTVIGDILDDKPVDYDKLEDMKKDFKKGSDLVSVQPMSMPIGKLLYLDFKYEPDKESFLYRYIFYFKSFWNKTKKKFKKTIKWINDTISSRHDRPKRYN